MKKVIRLTESQLNRYIKTVISEQPLSNPDDYAATFPAPEEPVAAKPQPYTPDTPGSQVTEIQKYLITLGYNVGPTGADGYMGPETERAISEFQTKNGMLATGKVDQKLYDALEREARTSPMADSSKNTPDVATLQRNLNSWREKKDPSWPELKPDGIRGPNTKKAIMAFQKHRSLPVNGYFDPPTVKALNAAFSGKGSTNTTPTAGTKPTSAAASASGGVGTAIPSTKPPVSKPMPGVGSSWAMHE